MVRAMGQLIAIQLKKRPSEEKINLRIEQIFLEIEEELRQTKFDFSTLKPDRKVEKKYILKLKHTLNELDERFADKIQYLDFNHEYQPKKPRFNATTPEPLQISDVISILKGERDRWPTLILNVRKQHELGRDDNNCLISDLTTSKELYAQLTQATILFEGHAQSCNENKNENSSLGDSKYALSHAANTYWTPKLQEPETAGGIGTELIKLLRLNDELKKQRAELEYELKKTKNQFGLRIEQLGLEVNALKETCRQTEEDNELLRKQNDHFDNQLQLLLGEKTRRDSEFDHLSQLLADTSAKDDMDGKLKTAMADLQKQKRMIADLQKRYEDSESSNQDLLCRLSKIAGEKLTTNNPNIADLSDNNRPTKLGEKYSELYDNEWTDAFDALEEAGHDAIDIIDALKRTILHTFEFCTNKSSLFKKKINDAVNLIFDERDTDKCDKLNKTGTSERKPHMDAFPPQQVIQMAKLWMPKTLNSTVLSGKKAQSDRADVKLVNAAVHIRALEKEVAGSILPILQKQYFDTMWDDQCLPAVRPYIERCLYICWMMVVQSPPMVFAPQPEQGSTIDSNLYKNYLSMGKKVAYVVWPALLLHTDGGVICKGIAEVHKDSAKNRLGI